MKALARRQVFLVAGRALLMLPVFMALWYFAGTPLTWVPAVGATPILRAISGGSVAMHQKGRDVTYTVKLEMPYRPGVTPRVAVDVEVAAAKFTYGIALFLALCLAAKESHNGVGIVVGSAVLLVLPMVGIAFDALKQLAVTPGMLTFLMWGRGTGEGVALGYQVGTLLLPTLAPVVIWLGLARKLWAPDPEFEAARPMTTA
ncbi:MAG: exosortase H-associated membrane protein [Usitatibacter sp.]